MHTGHACKSVNRKLVAIVTGRYNNEHDVIVYMVIKDTQSKYRQLRQRFLKSPFSRVENARSVNDRLNRSKSYVLKCKNSLV